MLNGCPLGSIFSGRLSILWRNGAPRPRTEAPLRLVFIAQLCHEQRWRNFPVAATARCRYKHPSPPQAGNYRERWTGVDIKSRIKNILLTPTTEWPAIDAEPTPTGTVVTSYVIPLAAIGAIAGFIGGSLVGTTLPFLGTYRVPVMTGLVWAILAFCFAIRGVFILAFIINPLTPTIG